MSFWYNLTVPKREKSLIAKFWGEQSVEFSRSLSLIVLVLSLVVTACSPSEFSARRAQVINSNSSQNTESEITKSGEVTTKTISIIDEFKEIHFVQKNPNEKKIPREIFINKLDVGNVEVTYSFERSGITSQHRILFSDEDLTCTLTKQENIRYMNQYAVALRGVEAYVKDSCRKSINGNGIVETVCEVWEDRSAHYIQFLTDEEVALGSEGMAFHLFKKSVYNGPGNLVVTNPDKLKDLFEKLIVDAMAEAADCAAPPLN